MALIDFRSQSLLYKQQTSFQKKEELKLVKNEELKRETK